ncbi:MAG TPA: NAD(P)H-hydrate dehydratase [Terriglobia bacterium]|nr:NAD(P)H-hydrate dehydratase [Terriglobia bacterium]
MDAFVKILTAAQMQQIDRMTSERWGVPSLDLMENAGNAVTRFLAARYAPLAGQKILVACGRGNNGGDGFVVARLLRQNGQSGQSGLNPRVLLFADPGALRGDAAVNYRRLAESGTPEAVPDAEAWRKIRSSVSGSTLIIDALLGTGLTKPLQGFLLEVVRDLNGISGARRVAVDLPTGLSADTGELIGECIHADASVTFTAPKYAHVFPPACEQVGEWRVEQIGTPVEKIDEVPELFLSLICREDLLWLAAPRKLDSHKGLYGHVLIIAGSVGKTGAAALAAKGALRAGAGLVTVATPESALPVVAALGMEFMTEPLPETSSGTVALAALDGGQLDRLAEGKSVVAIGPGLGSHPETAEAIRQFVNRCPAPVVLDADGLNAFAGRISDLKAAGRVRVLTPHPGEMARLTGLATADIQKRRIEVARQFAMQNQVVLALKGARTLVASPDGRVAVNPTGNPGMATGGTGDCLTGILAGLIAQHGLREISSVVNAAVYLHGLAGDIAAARTGEASMIAGDLLETIPQAFNSLRRASE